jgi:ABC-type glycerol-3-phosphate transport system substrate-binding protein
MHGLTFVVNSASPNVADSIKFIAWYNTNARRAALEFGQSPPIAALYTDPTMAQQLGDWWTKMGEYLKIGVATEESAAKAVWVMQLSKDINQAIAGQVTAQQALDQAAQEITAAEAAQ